MPGAASSALDELDTFTFRFDLFAVPDSRRSDAIVFRAGVATLRVADCVCSNGLRRGTRLEDAVRRWEEVVSSSAWEFDCALVVRGGRNDGLGKGAVRWRLMGSASILERSVVFLRFNELSALCAALIDNGEGCGKLYSPECRTDVASSFWSGSVLELLFRGVTSLREWLSQCREVCDGVLCRVLRESSECRDVVDVA